MGVFVLAQLHELISELEDFADVQGLNYDTYAGDLKTTFLGNLEYVYANKERFDQEIAKFDYEELLWIVVGNVFIEVQVWEYGDDHLVLRVVSGDSDDDFVTADRIRLVSESDFASFVRTFDFHVRNVMKLAS